MMNSRDLASATQKTARVMAAVVCMQTSLRAMADDPQVADPLPTAAETSLNDAADNEAIEFSTYTPWTAATTWTGIVTANAADGQDAVVSPVFRDLGPSAGYGLQAAFATTGTTRVEFDIRFNLPFQYPSLNPLMGLLVDGASYDLDVNGEGWTHYSALVGPGKHRIVWWSPVSWVGSDVRRLMLDRITLTPVEGLSPNEAVDLPHSRLAGIVPVNADARGVSDVSRDGVDSLRLTIPAGGSATIVTSGAVWDEIHLWALTDAPPGSVRLGSEPYGLTFAIASGEWVPLLLHRDTCIVYNGNDAPVHVWLDSITGAPVRDSQWDRVHEILAEGLDWPPLAATIPVSYGTFFSYLDPAISHDGTDVAVLQEWSDDSGPSYLDFPVAGPASISFWWRYQHRESGGRDSVWMTFGEASQTPNRLYTFDTAVVRNWQHASINIPGGAASFRIAMKDAYHSLLFMDQFEVGAVDASKTYAGLMSLKGLAGPAAAPDFDADRDGWENLSEYALGTDPASVTGHPVSPLELVWRTGETVPAILRLSGFRPAAHFDTTITLQSSPSLDGQWQEIEKRDRYEYRPEADGSVTVSIPVTHSGRAFYRAMFSLAP